MEVCLMQRQIRVSGENGLLTLFCSQGLALQPVFMACRYSQDSHPPGQSSGDMVSGLMALHVQCSDYMSTSWHLALCVVLYLYCF